jgi:hypothetical protein
MGRQSFHFREHRPNLAFVNTASFGDLTIADGA